MQRGAGRRGRRGRGAWLLGLLVLLQVGVRRLSVEGSVTNSAADFLGSLQPPDPAEFRLRPDWLHLLPHDLDDTLMMAPPDMPDELQHPYFKRVDFMPVQNAAQRYIADDHLLGAGSFYRGPPLPDLDPLMRAGPFKGRDGPLAMPRQPFLTSTAPLPLGGRSELRQTFRSSVDQPLEAEYGDVGAFLREADNRLGVGDQGPKFHESPLENPLDALQLKHFDVSQSRTLRALRSQIDDDIVHPDDRAPLADPAQQGALQPGMDMSSRSTVLRSADGEFLLNSENEFGADKFEFKLKVAADPLRMQYERAAHVSKQHPATDLTLQPVITGGVCIGFRCSDGVVSVYVYVCVYVCMYICVCMSVFEYVYVRK